MRMNKIYTKTGDKGTTSLVGGERVDKFNIKVESYGTIDELNSVVGLLRSFLNSEEHNPDLDIIIDELGIIQNVLFDLGSYLASSIIAREKYGLKFCTDKTEMLEKTMDKWLKVLPKLNSFIIPGGSISSSYMHLARTVCRRAERTIVNLSKQEEVNDDSLKFINRLSDYFFVLARYYNFLKKNDEILWTKC
ncbi:MAG: cob(I)yrinic acid a,c-diamide adenosyltransferase [Candidatus Delongbacteria bacterium]|nr:cob(I)yrinic acid a,c-diamide adenosyltransferase [Candidatus Delongbacteria bacterium]MBN2835823.1 cob(I)yrinic acid a,c-diamide adenosyltransferase [Candidatus Delongbacteria bacterium]